MRVVNDDKALRALLALVAGCAVLVYICSVAIAGISILESGKYVAGGLTLICAALAGVLLRAGERRAGCGYGAIAAGCMVFYASYCAGPIVIQAPLALLTLICPLAAFGLWPRDGR